MPSPEAVRQQHPQLYLTGDEIRKDKVTEKKADGMLSDFQFTEKDVMGMAYVL